MITALTLTGQGLSFLATEVEQTLTLGYVAPPRPTINGTWVSGWDNKTIYSTSIRGKGDQIPPLHDGHMGHPIKVGCISPMTLCLPSHKGPIHLPRFPVDGSVRVQSVDGGENLGYIVKGQTIMPIDLDHPANLCVTFRPLLTMHLMDFTSTIREWDPTCTWEAHLKECIIMP